MGQPERLYSAAEASRALRCSEWWIKEQARRRRIPFLMLGGAYRFTGSHLAEILATFEVRPTGTATPEATVRSASCRRPRAVGAQTTALRPRPPRRAQRTADAPPAA